MLKECCKVSVVNITRFTFLIISIDLEI